MTRQYYRLRGMDGELLDIVYYNENNKKVCIPFDKANTDYQEYLEWVAKNNKVIKE